MGTENDPFGEKYRSLYVGVVVDNADPESVGRVRVRVNGFIDKSDWALPMGSPGAGTHRRGWYDPPDVGAEVCLFFNGGDPDKPHYLPGAWGRPSGVRETPGPVGGYATPNLDTSPGTPEDIPPADAPLVKAYETARWVMVFDDRPGKEKFYVEDKKSGDHLLFDGAAGRAELRVTALLRILCDGIIRLDGAQVVINERNVLPSSKPL